MTLTPTEIRKIADAHVDAWTDSDPIGGLGLRVHVSNAITEALTKQAALYQSGADTLRHERDTALRCRDEAVQAAELIASDLAAERMKQCSS